MSRPVVVALTREEAETVWNVMEYAFEGLDSDMSLGPEERVELRKLEELKDRIKKLLDDQQGRNGGW